MIIGVGLRKEKVEMIGRWKGFFLFGRVTVVDEVEDKLRLNETREMVYSQLVHV